MRARIAIAFALALGSASAAQAASPPLVTPARPSFPPPDRALHHPGPTRLALVSSRRRDPATVERVRWVGWAPRAFHGLGLLQTFSQPGTVFLVYGVDGTQARVVVGADAKTHAQRYAFDFARFARPPLVNPGDAGLVTEQVVWAREARGVLYVETAHQTYAASSGGRNGYVTAVSIRTGGILWRSPSLVANASNFVLAGDALVTGYGFTNEPDYLYVLDAASGRVRDRLAVPSAPQWIVRRRDRLTVRTYDRTLAVELHRS
jgi:hypothetical protein